MTTLVMIIIAELMEFNQKYIEIIISWAKVSLVITYGNINIGQIKEPEFHFKSWYFYG
jgi:hypothetical protein